jgi:hypothetical protein
MGRLGVADSDNLNESEAGQDCSLGCGRCERDIKRDIHLHRAGRAGRKISSNHKDIERDKRDMSRWTTRPARGLLKRDRTGHSL